MAAAVNTSAALDGNTVTSITTGAVSPSGSDLFMLGVSVTGGASAPNTTAFKYGGSGGTSLSAAGATGSFGFGFGNFTTWKIAPGPSGSTTAYASFGAANFAAIAGVFFTGVDQVTPLGTEVSGPNNNFAAAPITDALSLTGLTPGQLVIGAVAVNDIGGSGIVSIVAGASTTVVVNGLAAGAATGEQRASVSVLSGVADGSGNLTLNYTITMLSAGVNICWQHTAFPVNDASGAAAAILNIMVLGVG